MDFGVVLPTVGPVADRDFLLEIAGAAERLGLHSVWASDHIVLPAERSSVYPYPESTTEFAFTPGVTWLDPVAAMSVVAGATERIAIGTSVLVLPYRNPVVLAGELATVDRLSGGRILLGIGAGWMDEEFEAVGVPKAERGARTEEHIRVLKTLWASEGPTSFAGRFTTLSDVVLAASPLRPGGPPILVGGNTPPALRRAGRLGDGWHGFEIPAVRLRDMREAIDDSARGAGRDPSEISLSVRRALLPPFEVTNFLPGRLAVGGSTRAAAEEISRYAMEGVSLLVFDLAMLPAESIATMEWLVGEVAPLIA